MSDEQPAAVPAKVPDPAAAPAPAAAPVAPTSAAPAPVAQPAAEVKVETKQYTDGTTATGVAPLPDKSPTQQLLDSVEHDILGLSAWPQHISVAIKAIFDSHRNIKV